MHRQHAAYYLKRATDLEALRSEQPATAIEQAEQDYPNMLAALRWCEVSDDTGIAARLVDKLGWFWGMHGGGWQLREWFRAILLQTPAAETPADRARRLYNLAHKTLDLEEEQRLKEESLAIYRSIGNQTQVAAILFEMAESAYHAGDDLRSAQLIDESVALARALGDPHRLSSMLHNLGDMAREDGNYPRAEALFAETLAMRRQAGRTEDIADTLNATGDLAFYQGELARAEVLYREAYTLFQETKHRNMIGWLLRNLGRVAHAQGDDDRARELLVQSLLLFQQHGLIWAIGCCLDAMAGVVGACGQPERAARLFGAGEKLRQMSGANSRWTWPIGARVDYASDVALVRSALSEETFAAAWKAGRQMSPEQAIAYALDDSD